MTGVLDLDHLRQWVGREELSEEVITPALAARFHATLSLPGVPAVAGGVAPALIHFCLCQPTVTMAGLGSDGHPARGDFLPPVPLPRRMWAGSTIDFHNALRVGDAVVRRSRIADLSAKFGRSGTLCFVTIDHHVTTNGVLSISERQTLVYREPAGGDPSVSPEPASSGARIDTIDASAPLLFRYSALTFNAHRIHYDLPYARDEEGYPGLVVHGPLQATLLLHLAARCHGGRVPDRFSFRGVRPTFGGKPLMLHAGDLIDGSMDLWTSGHGEPAAMLASAQWQ
jgi:3-methylfumaryl-CoA hydratase